MVCVTRTTTVDQGPKPTLESKIEDLKFEKMAKRIRAEVRNAVHRRIRRKVEREFPHGLRP